MPRGQKTEVLLGGAEDERLILDIAQVRNRELYRAGIFVMDGMITLEVDENGECGLSDFCRDLLYFGLVNSMREERKPVWVILNSPGGLVHDGFGVYNLLQALVQSGTEVNILGMGAVASIAALVLQAGVMRYSFPDTRFLIHEVSQKMLFVDEKVSEGKERVAEIERLNMKMIEIIAERTGLELQDLLKRTTRKEFWLSAEEALNLGPHGLIDKIVTNLPFIPGPGNTR